MDAIKLSREEQANQTRSELIAIGLRLFTRNGYHATGTHELVAAANVSRGALCHHFPKKDDLFLAVFQEVQRALTERVRTSIPDNFGADRWQRFRARLMAFLDAATLPEVQRIMLLDGPSVLGWKTWHELQAQSGLDAIQESLESAMNTGLIKRQRIAPLAQLMLAAMNHAALMVANAENPSEARMEVEEALDTLLFNMATKPQRPTS